MRKDRSGEGGCSGGEGGYPGGELRQSGGAHADARAAGISRAAVLALPAALLAACAGAQQEGVSAAAQPELQSGELYVFMYRPGPAWREGVPMREQGLGPHAGYIRALMDQGRLFAGGGFDDRGGLAIVIASERAQAEAMLAADPAIVSGVFVATLERWTPRFRTDAPLPRAPQ